MAESVVLFAICCAIVIFLYIARAGRVKKWSQSAASGAGAVRGFEVRFGRWCGEKIGKDVRVPVRV